MVSQADGEHIQKKERTIPLDNCYAIIVMCNNHDAG